MEDSVTLRFWHGGLFKKNRLGITEYIGGQVKTYAVDPDHLCGWFLNDMAKECGDYRMIEKMFYLVPHCIMDDGLRQVFEDKQVLEMREFVLKSRSIDLFVLHGVDTPEVVHDVDAATNIEQENLKTPTKASHPKETDKKTPQVTPPQKAILPTQKNKPTKFTPPNTKKTPTKVTPPRSTPLRCSPRIFNRQQSTNNNPPATKNQTQPAALISQTAETEVEDLNSTNPTEKEVDEDEYFRWYDPRPDSPIPLNDLIGSYGSESSGDSNYEGNIEDLIEEDSDTELEPEFDIEGDSEEEFQSEKEVELDDDVGDSSDEELREAREWKRRTNEKLLKISQQLEEKIVEGSSRGEGPINSSEQGEDGYVSDYANTDDEDSPNEDACEDAILHKKKQRKLRVDQGADWSTFQWKVGQRFPNREAFREAVRKYSIYQGKHLTFTASNKKRGQRLEVRCLEVCKFRLYASWDASTACFLVKSVDDGHACVRNMEKNRQLKNTWLSKQFLEIFKTRPHWPAKEIVETVKRAYKVVISTDFAYSVKYNAHEMLHGSMKDHYLKVGRYIEAVKKATPGTKLELVTDNEANPPVFKRLFVCFEGLAQGWRDGCRRVLCIDACFIKTFLGGQLLSAVGRDGNDQMFPVAWAVVEGENIDSWEWFLNLVRECLVLNEGSGLSIISDEHLAILAAVERVLPQAEHRHCARHIYAHWHKSFRGDEYKKLFWRAAKAYSEADYNDALEDMRKVNPEAVEAFESHNPRWFCRHQMNTQPKVDVILNNLAETFNGYIINSRTKHLLFMLEEIRTNLMQRLAVKKQEMQKVTSKLCPRIQAKVDKAKDEAAKCVVVPSTVEIFQVSEGMEVQVVNLATFSCTCGVWDLSGIPCGHAVACIFFMRMEAEDFVSHWYTTSTYLRSYNYSIPPCVGERQWPKIDLPLVPPPIKVGPGRPRKNRIKDPFENPKKPGRLTKHGIQMTCSVCKSTEHNIRRCPNKNNRSEERGDTSAGPPTKRQRAATHDNGGECSGSATLHDVTAHPTRTGRGGRVIRGGRGARGVGGNVGVPWRGRGNRGSMTTGRGTKGRDTATVSSRGGQTDGVGGRGRGTGGTVGRGRGTDGRGRGRGQSRGGRGGRGRNNQIPVGVGVFISTDGSAFHNEPGMQGPRLLSQSSTTVGGCPLGTQGSAAT